MVCIDITLFNETEFSVIEGRTEGDSLKSRDGNLSCEPGETTECTLRPKSGFAGIEKGIEYTFHLRCGSHDLQLKLDFPAVGFDTYVVEGDLSKINAVLVHNGKTGPNNSHQLEVRLKTKRRRMAVKKDEKTSLFANTPRS